MLSEKTETQKAMYYMFPFVWYSIKANWRDRKQTSDARDWGWVGRGLT